MTADLIDYVPLIEAKVAAAEAALDAGTPGPWERFGERVVRGVRGSVRSVGVQYGTTDADLIVLAVNGLRESIKATRDVLARHRRVHTCPDLDGSELLYGRAGDGEGGEFIGGDCPDIANEARRWEVSRG